MPFACLDSERCASGVLKEGQVVSLGTHLILTVGKVFPDNFSGLFGETF